jgi:hypothetical protein
MAAASDDPASNAAVAAATDLPGSLHTAVLQDGRTVSYSVCGSTSPDAHTVLFLHPLQGNRYYYRLSDVLIKCLTEEIYRSQCALVYRAAAVCCAGAGACAGVPTHWCRD